MQDYFYESREYCLQDYQKNSNVGWNLFLCKPIELLQKKLSYVCKIDLRNKLEENLPIDLFIDSDCVFSVVSGFNNFYLRFHQRPENLHRKVCYGLRDRIFYDVHVPSIRK